VINFERNSHMAQDSSGSSTIKGGKSSRPPRLMERVSGPSELTVGERCFEIDGTHATEQETRRCTRYAVGMCARYTLTRSELGEIVKLLGADVDPSARQIHLPRFNVGPAQQCVIAVGGDGARASRAPVLIAARWGLQLGGRMVVNLRSETAGRRPGLQRCVVPTDGFYEWTGEKPHRRPIWFHRPSGELVLLAGLLEAAVGAPPTFAVLTAPARAPVVEIHDRMPVVLGAERARSWLARGGGPDVEELGLVATEVSARANSVTNDDASVLDPTPPRGQLRLL
jgi:putative SOS response-associated peptidase YedK